jgi:hypothetical protein
MALSPWPQCGGTATLRVARESTALGINMPPYPEVDITDVLSEIFKQLE